MSRNTRRREHARGRRRRPNRLRALVPLAFGSAVVAVCLWSYQTLTQPVAEVDAVQRDSGPPGVNVAQNPSRSSQQATPTARPSSRQQATGGKQHRDSTSDPGPAASTPPSQRAADPDRPARRPEPRPRRPRPSPSPSCGLLGCLTR